MVPSYCHCTASLRDVTSKMLVVEMRSGQMPGSYLCMPALALERVAKCELITGILQVTSPLTSESRIEII